MMVASTMIPERSNSPRSSGAQRANDRARIATPTIQDVAEVEAPATQGGRTR